MSKLEGKNTSLNKGFVCGRFPLPQSKKGTSKNTHRHARKGVSSENIWGTIAVQKTTRDSLEICARGDD